MFLDKCDKKILGALEDIPLHSSEISRRINMPRTTVSYRLQRLKKYDYLSKKIIGKKSVWSTVARGWDVKGSLRGS